MMRIRALLSLVLLVLAAGCAMMSGGPAPGDVLYVSCAQSMPLHAAPSALSAEVGALKYGAAVTILAVMPAADTKRDDLPRWAKVQGGGISGFAPLRSLVSRRLLERQSQGGASAAQKAGEQGVGRGFSESVKPDLVATKGAGGSARSGQAQYEPLNEQLRAHVNEKPREGTADFRREGKLAEFNQ